MSPRRRQFSVFPFDRSAKSAVSMVVTGTISAGIVSLTAIVILLFEVLLPLDTGAGRVRGIAIVAVGAAVLAIAIFKHNRAISIVGLIGAMWLWWNYLQHGAAAGLWVMSGLFVGIAVGVLGVFRIHSEARRREPSQSEGV